MVDIGFNEVVVYFDKKISFHNLNFNEFFLMEFPFFYFTVVNEEVYLKIFSFPSQYLRISLFVFGFSFYLVALMRLESLNVVPPSLHNNILLIE